MQNTITYMLLVYLKIVETNQSSLVNTPQIQRNTRVAYSNRKSVTFRISLIGLSVLLHKAILIVYSRVTRGVLQP